MKDSFVVDASVAACWCFEDEKNDYADSVLRTLERFSATVPILWKLEMANLLIQGERRSRLTRSKMQTFASFLKDLPLKYDLESIDHALDRVTELAWEHQLKAYDACYLELSLRLSLPLATLDKRLRNAAEAVGVSLYLI